MTKHSGPSRPRPSNTMRPDEPDYVAIAMSAGRTRPTVAAVYRNKQIWEVVRLWLAGELTTTQVTAAFKATESGRGEGNTSTGVYSYISMTVREMYQAGYFKER